MKKRWPYASMHNLCRTHSMPPRWLPSGFTREVLPHITSIRKVTWLPARLVIANLSGWSTCLYNYIEAAIIIIIIMSWSRISRYFSEYIWCKARIRTFIMDSWHLLMQHFVSVNFFLQMIAQRKMQQHRTLQDRLPGNAPQHVRMSSYPMGP